MTDGNETCQVYFVAAEGTLHISDAASHGTLKTCHSKTVDKYNMHHRSYSKRTTHNYLDISHLVRVNPRVGVLFETGLYGIAVEWID